MKKSRCNEAQIMAVLREQEAGSPTADMCRRYGISGQTFYRWKAKLCEDRREATEPNEAWAMDFVHDQLATGRRIRVLTVEDNFTRYSPVINPRFSYRAENVVEALDRV